ncbi:Os03g0158800 [Oryza sativa Japonica Group]|uniref:Os03g0158800 protein n=2 Tax=Oryza sativa subsp. japonica TaxID=39947 RepID=Q0DUZ9_ORYSJ|nr:hypothetical protein EE612_015428 [Oryza sativa]BAF10939.1 Os03g0158800 [Oryza sativa Japonica Group]BAS82394.1 Os03g0158800 [Oryza sativa Japonica Group]|eukprot:NP_001049025.1 Os03g0158800 [Oryza sativa Japonica Group]
MYAVVISADLMAAGDHVGCTALTTATMPETCGHDMDVPESKFHVTERLSSGITVGDDMGGHAARMFTPGAVTSGCTRRITNQNTRINGFAIYPIFS